MRSDFSALFSGLTASFWPWITYSLIPSLRRGCVLGPKSLGIGFVFGEEQGDVAFA